MHRARKIKWKNSIWSDALEKWKKKKEGDEEEEEEGGLREG